MAHQAISALNNKPWRSTDQRNGACAVIGMQDCFVCLRVPLRGPGVCTQALTGRGLCAGPAPAAYP